MQPIMQTTTQLFVLFLAQLVLVLASPASGLSPIGLEYADFDFTPPSNLSEYGPSTGKAALVSPSKGVGHPPSSLNETDISGAGIYTDDDPEVPPAACPAPKFTYWMTEWTTVTPTRSSSSTHIHVTTTTTTSIGPPTTVIETITSWQDMPMRGPKITVPWLSCETRAHSLHCFKHMGDTVTLAAAVEARDLGGLGGAAGECRGPKCPHHTASPITPTATATITGTGTTTTTTTTSTSSRRRCPGWRCDTPLHTGGAD